MGSKLAHSKKRTTILLAAVTCAILIASAIWLQTSENAQAATINPHPGLVGWWRFDENSGTIAGDSSGNGNNGTLSGSTLPSWVAGKFGQALSFSNDAYVSTGLNNLPTQAGTWTAWVKYTTTGGVVYASDGVLFELTSNGVLGQISGGSYLAGGSPSANTWQFCALTYDGSTIKAYLNGVLVGSLAQSGNINAAKYSWINDPYGEFAGTIDEVRIYNRALSASQIQTDFQQSPDFSPYLLANVPQGTTQVITTLSWQGTGNINVTITTPSQTYTESMMAEYQKTTYSTTSGGPINMLNIKRLSISVNALTSAQSWNITLTYDSTVSAYQISVETQK